MITVQIEPTIAFANGQRMAATQFNVVSIQDDLFENVTFKYTLFDQNMSWAGESVYSLAGKTEYQKWDTTPEGAYQIVADGIGLTISNKDTKAMFIEVA